ncbi:MAG: alpha/beta fold hydrolase [Stellaceae bacterium]
MILPAPHAVLDIAGEDDASLRVRRHGNLRGNRLIVSHGNGFAIDGYAGFWGRFLDGFEVIAFDARNHGWNPPADPPGHDYLHLARDLVRVCAAVGAEFGAKPTAGVFHSMSAQAAMLATLETGGFLDALVCFDPPNVPPGGPARATMLDYLARLTRWASGRRDVFADPAELAAEYAATRSGREWAPGTALLVARAVLRSDGACRRLSCPRELEASMYRQGAPLDLWPVRRQFALPLKLIGADSARERPSPTALSNQALAETGGFDYVAIPGTSHLLQLEAPEACAAAVREFLEAAGFG